MSVLRSCAAVAMFALLAGVSSSQNAVEPVTFVSADGFSLHGTYYNPGHPGPAVLLLHQCNRRSAETGFERLAPVLARRGIHVLTYDSRGFGKSRSSAYPEYRSNMEVIDTRVGEDVEAALRFLKSRNSVDPERIGVVGASCGTWKAINAAAADPAIRTFVFLSGSYLDLEDTRRAYAGITHLPVLAIYSENDRFRTPESMQHAFRESQHPQSRLISYKGSLHGAPLLQHDPGLGDTIAAWFVEHLFSSR